MKTFVLEVGSVAFGKLYGYSRAYDKEGYGRKVNDDSLFFGVFGHKSILTELGLIGWIYL